MSEEIDEPRALMEDSELEEQCFELVSVDGSRHHVSKAAIMKFPGSFFVHSSGERCIYQRDQVVCDVQATRLDAEPDAK
jgi:hypothetical protein